MSKLEQAIQLCENNEDYQNFSKGLKLFDDLIMNRMMSKNLRAKAVIALSKIASDQAEDKMARLRDTLPFLEGEDLENEIDMVASLVHHPQINSHDRLLSAVCLYNNGRIDICYTLFEHLANDISILLNYRVEAARYLFFSEVPEYVKVARDCLAGIIESQQYQSDYRYKVIAGFITTTGLASMLNLGRLEVDYNEKFVYYLQNKFFWNEKNGVRERILSGQHMLGMTEKNVKPEMKKKISDTLLEIARSTDGEDEADTENIRADAADVLLRLGTSEYQDAARDIIRGLGFMLTEDGKHVHDLTLKQKTAYTDRQNVHDSTINESVNKFIDEHIETADKQRETYQSVHTDVTELIYSSGLRSKQRIKAFKSLNRISIDTATFSHKRYTTSDIFVHIWMLIKKHNDEEQKLLKSRMVDELVDMADTCSSGHASRLINVLAGYDVEIKISWKDQIHANMAGRMQKKIREIEDEELKEMVVMGMIKDAEPEDRDAFVLFVTENIGNLKKELEKEFVGEGHVTQEEFDGYFESGTSEWI